MTRTSWRELYEAAVSETDPRQFSRKSDLAIGAMHQRIDELPLNGASGDEKRAIVEALKSLQKILQHKASGLAKSDSKRSDVA